MTVPSRFGGKVALIVGGGSGIAAECARIIRAEGGTVAAFDRDATALDALILELDAMDGSPCLALTGDALKEEDAQRAVAAVVERFGKVDILVNAVGGSTIIKNFDAPIEETSVDDWAKLIDFNMLTCFLFSRAVVPVMKKQRSGKIVNVSSKGAYGMDSRTVAYGASKAGVIGLTRKLARELGPFGINVNNIAPGLTMSPRLVEVAKTGPQSPDDRNYTHIPLRRPAYPEDQARVICFLASRDADYVTGVTIDVTGGQ